MNTHSQTVVIQNPFGLHMRPIAEILKIAYTFDSSIMFHKADKSARGHSVVEMLLLGAFCGEELHVSAVGHDAVKAVVFFVEHYTDEESPKGDDIRTFAA